jgi:hypothetical protein
MTTQFAQPQTQATAQQMGGGVAARLASQANLGQAGGAGWTG